MTWFSQPAQDQKHISATTDQPCLHLHEKAKNVLGICQLTSMEKHKK